MDELVCVVLQCASGRDRFPRRVSAPVQGHQQHFSHQRRGYNCPLRQHQARCEYASGVL